MSDNWRRELNTEPVLKDILKIFRLNKNKSKSLAEAAKENTNSKITYVLSYNYNLSSFPRNSRYAWHLILALHWISGYLFSFSTFSYSFGNLTRRWQNCAGLVSNNFIFLWVETICGKASMSLIQIPTYYFYHEYVL